MNRRHLLLCIATASLLGMGSIHAQPFPAKPVRIITTDPGGAGDTLARVIALGLSASSTLGQKVFVENRGNGLIPPGIVAKAVPDGYTVLFHGNSVWLGPLFAETPYDPLRDFAAVSLTSRAPNMLVVNASVPVNSVKELVALAKSKPGELNYASVATGSFTHLAAEMFKSMAGLSIERVGYKALGTGFTDVVAGRVTMIFPSASAVAPFLKSGKLRALAVTSLEPSTLAPDLPTMAASGFPGYESITVNCVLAPAGTPPAVISRLNQELVRYLKTPDAQERFSKMGVEIVASTPEHLSTFMKTEMGTISKLIKDANIKTE
jgi:tripartite-type tricarboxylate transporter receptor subunit TctC